MSDHASNDRDDLPRQVDLAIVRVDPWGVMKVTFLLSVGHWVSHWSLQS